MKTYKNKTNKTEDNKNLFNKKYSLTKKCRKILKIEFFYFFSVDFSFQRIFRNVINLSYFDKNEQLLLFDGFAARIIFPVN